MIPSERNTILARFTASHSQENGLFVPRTNFSEPSTAWLSRHLQSAGLVPHGEAAVGSPLVPVVHHGPVAGSAPPPAPARFPDPEGTRGRRRDPPGGNGRTELLHIVRPLACDAPSSLAATASPTVPRSHATDETADAAGERNASASEKHRQFFLHLHEIEDRAAGAAGEVLEQPVPIHQPHEEARLSSPR